MKEEICPRCESFCRSVWVKDRKLQSRCSQEYDADCSWTGEPYVPEIKPIEITREIMANQFYGYCFTAFDQYGHTMTISRSYDTEEECVAEATDDLKRSNNKHGNGQCTAIVWPSTVTVTGKKITL